LTKINVASAMPPQISKMTYTDALLALPTYPDRMPRARMREALKLAKLLARNVYGITVIESFVGTTFSAFGDIVLDLPAIAAGQTKRSYENAHLTAADFEQLATEENFSSNVISETCNSAEVSSRLLRHARMHDVTIVPLMPSDQFCQCDPETLLFESGRPVFVLPLEFNRAKSDGIGTVAVAWDFSGPAARALSDALPILRTAESVRVVTIDNEKPIEPGASGEELRRFLGRRGVTAMLERYDAAGRKIGAALNDYVKQHGIDLLVMGGYGHSRVREFVLGGATASMLSNPPVPVLLSH
jgi:nucleotide-binding universal stress UspA family protein